MSPRDPLREAILSCSRHGGPSGGVLLCSITLAAVDDKRKRTRSARESAHDYSFGHLVISVGAISIHDVAERFNVGRITH